MQWMRASFAAVVVALGFGLSAEAREGNPTIASQRALVAEASDFGSLGGQKEVAENLPDCRKVDVDLDEGYGVTGHATRDECPPSRR
jgi:hypothetical protein